MRPSAVLESPEMFRRPRVIAAAIGVSVAAMVVVGSSAAATSPTSRACPSATVVGKALGERVGAPVATLHPSYSKTCTYPGGGIGSTKITFQVDTALTFAASEKAAGMFGAKIIKVHGLGQAAWTTGLGDIYVFAATRRSKCSRYR